MIRGLIGDIRNCRGIVDGSDGNGDGFCDGKLSIIDDDSEESPTALIGYWREGDLTIRKCSDCANTGTRKQILIGGSC